MPGYRFCKLNAGKRIAAAGEDRDFNGDLRAFEHAGSLANGHAIGVWEGARFVVNVEAVKKSSEGVAAPGKAFQSCQSATVSTKYNAARMRFG